MSTVATAGVLSGGFRRRRRLAIAFGGPAAAAVFTLTMVFQGVHEADHMIQYVQIWLGDPGALGVFGRFVDTEPAHFAAASIYLSLLATVYLLLDLDRTRSRRWGAAVFLLLSFALAGQAWHTFEHAVKLQQYLSLGQNRTGGVLGRGIGGWFPLVPIPTLHLFYNSVTYYPALAAYLILLRRR